LPLEDDDHMPPKGKPQLTEDEIKSIEMWIAGGADWGSPAKPASPPVTTAPAQQADKATPPPDAKTLSVLRSNFVHVEAVTQGSNRLYVDFAAIAGKATDAEALRLIKPILPQLEVLSLARCPIGDETAKLLAAAPQMRQL